MPGRRKRSGDRRRFVARLSPESAEIFDRYSDVERSEILDRALREMLPRSTSANCPPVLFKPDTAVCSTVCRISLRDNAVRLLLPEKDDDFRSLVKRFCYQWDGIWVRNFSQGVDIADRAAEIASALLVAGFWVQVDNETVRDRVISQSFVPESFKTIKRVTSGTYRDYFVIDWPRHEDCYAEAMKLTAAKYSDGSVYVPAEHFAEVQDFAEINDFQLSTGAISLIDEAKAAIEAAIIIKPKQKRKKQQKNERISNGIPAHLRDDTDD